MNIPPKDIVFMASMIETFVKLLENPERFYKESTGLPESDDLRITSAALYFLGDCYLRGMGLKMHPASKTRVEAMEALAGLWDGINKEIEARTFLYPRLSGLIGRGKAAVELEWLVNGYSRWSDE